MVLTHSEKVLRPSRPPPLWFVTNGEITVGPVRTDLLQRGVFHGRIPEDCFVRELTWRTWRRLDQIREVRAVQREPGGGALRANQPGQEPGEAAIGRERALDEDGAEARLVARDADIHR